MDVNTMCLIVILDEVLCLYYILRLFYSVFFIDDQIIGFCFDISFEFKRDAQILAVVCHLICCFGKRGNEVNSD